MKGDFTYPTHCKFNGQEWRILSIDLQGGLFTLHDPVIGLLEDVDIEECEPIETKSPNLNAFKIVSRYPSSHKHRALSQYKKKVYISEASYLKYKDKIVRRWEPYYNISCYECVKGEWKLIYEKPCTK